MIAAHSRLGVVRVLEETPTLLHVVHPKYGYAFWARPSEFDYLCFVISERDLPQAA